VFFIFIYSAIFAASILNVQFSSVQYLQQCLNKLSDWADTNGFKFSPSKTVCIHFCKLRKHHPEPTLLLNGTPVPVVEETKFLGIVFDRKLSFIPHTKHLKDKCTKALNPLRVLAHTSWGADQETLLHLYRSLIQSKLDYGYVVYRSARSSYLRILDPIRNHALRLCLGAYRTSPASSLCVEANEPPSLFQAKKLSLQYCLKLSCNDNNPAYTAVFNSISTLYLKENLLNYLLLQSAFQLICKRLVSKRAMLLHLPYQPHRLGF